MKIMLVCASGMSTGLLMNKMNKESDLEVKAYGIQEYMLHMDDFEVILLAPQIMYKEQEVKEKSTIPVAMIPAMEYGMGNVDNIRKIAKKAIEEGK